VEIYCDLDFTAFPFDSHECDLKFGASSSLSSSLILNEPRLRYKDQKREFGEGPLNFNPSRLAFNVSLESLKEFEFSQAGYKYSFIGMRITLTRNNYGLLIGGYYGPTIIFSLLSLVSFSINPDIVSLTLGSCTSKNILSNGKILCNPSIKCFYSSQNQRNVQTLIFDHQKDDLFLF
jgi:hypothetical protein